MFSLFKNKVQKHKDKLRKIYFKEAQKRLKKFMNRSQIENELDQFDREFLRSETFKKYEKIAFSENWFIQDIISDERFILLAMYSYGLSHSEAKKTYMQFKSFAGW